MFGPFEGTQHAPEAARTMLLLALVLAFALCIASSSSSS
eukprot:CAMPEP_0206423842 /NCGR_PEP_ID=MMETSP0324_2-20121206/2895_1 /ASSEMBLY_ACC=CAM_ASM_000836 /TAXON_ID=2866 /ORGANISM="Crypthecodinium cohnii, Strain Seligo" /LENGTH=38 /DNA_ID= /DNA_START= /DNA_END= /DNA_ORIENTATION=